MNQQIWSWPFASTMMRVTGFISEPVLGKVQGTYIGQNDAALWLSIKR